MIQPRRSLRVVPSTVTLGEDAENLEERVVTFNKQAFPKGGHALVLVGGPGSGKSFTFKNVIPLHGKYLNSDEVLEALLAKLRPVAERPGVASGKLARKAQRALAMSDTLKQEINKMLDKGADDAEVKKRMGPRVERLVAILMTKKNSRTGRPMSPNAAAVKKSAKFWIDQAVETRGEAEWSDPGGAGLQTIRGFISSPLAKTKSGLFIERLKERVASGEYARPSELPNLVLETINGKKAIKLANELSPLGYTTTLVWVWTPRNVAFERNYMRSVNDPLKGRRLSPEVFDDLHDRLPKIMGMDPGDAKKGVNATPHFDNVWFVAALEGSTPSYEREFDERTDSRGKKYYVVVRTRKVKDADDSRVQPIKINGRVIWQPKEINKATKVGEGIWAAIQKQPEGESTPIAVPKKIRAMGPAEVDKFLASARAADVPTGAFFVPSA